MNWSQLRIFLPFHTSKTLCRLGKCLATGIRQTIGFCISSPPHINTFTQRPYQTSIQASSHRIIVITALSLFIFFNQFAIFDCGVCNLSVYILLYLFTINGFSCYNSLSTSKIFCQFCNLFKYLHIIHIPFD